MENLRMVRLVKLRESENPMQPLNISPGEERVGLLLSEPEVGKKIAVITGKGKAFVTSIVTEILPNDTYKTLNSYYKIYPEVTADLN